MLLMLDNYDSFTYNLVHLFEELGAEVRVFRNDAITVEEAEALDPSHLVISPGPGRPSDAGATLEIVRRLAGTTPTLGVCLGHQALVQAWGGRVIPHEPVHGKTTTIEHDGEGLFAGLPPTLTVGRYHSLIAESAAMPPVLEVSAVADQVVMAVRHRELPAEGVQFHPESVLTDGGKQLLKNFLA